ncbi:retention in endoplasmic reticulum protein 1, partial [Podochytrium sp. JEL0797]
YWATRGILIAFVCTFFPIFDVPVFWPILVFYFLILFGLTMKQRIKHMVKYKYVPWNFGKKSYGGGGGKSDK